MAQPLRRNDVNANNDVSANHVDQTAIQAQLRRILDRREFLATPRRREMLKYLVEETLAGHGDQLKGYTIGVSVFGRDEGYDPQADPVVRMEARRLRQDLSSYYVDAGRNDPVRITIPKGRYTPYFELNEAELLSGDSTEQRRDAPDLPTGYRDRVAEPTRTSPATWPAWFIAAVAVVVASTFAVWVLTARYKPSAAASNAQRGPAVVVLPYVSLSPDTESHYLADGLTADLIDNLMRFPGFRLYTRPPTPDVFRASSQEPTKLGRELGVTYVVRGNVATHGGQISINTQLLNATTGAVVWSKGTDAPLTPDNLFRTRRQLAGEIASELGTSYGIINSDLDARREAPKVANMQSYTCVLRAYDYRRSGFSASKFGPVLQCLEAAVKSDPDYSNAWAMLGWLYLDGGRFGFINENDLGGQYAKALETADRAIKQDPDNVLAISALSAINHYMRRYDESERLARRALELNPFDSDIIAQLGWRLSVRGKFDEGVPLLERAIARTANPPAWYFPLVAINDYLKGDYGKILETAKQFSANSSDLNQALIAIAYAELGDAGAARQALGNMSPDGTLSRDPASYFRRHGATDEITEAVVAALSKARSFALEN